MEILCEVLTERIKTFPSNYHDDFDSFWNWKQGKERDGSSILSKVNFESTYVKLSRILGGWQAFRNSNNKDPYGTLRESLVNIEKEYEAIRSHDLTNFQDVPRSYLSTIWHELGRIKEPEGRTNTRGRYNIISFCKPLMLLWGQTLAFDSNVRYNITGMDIRMDQYKWKFDKWYSTMMTFREYLNKTLNLKECIEKKSIEKYGEGLVPYGRFLDIYFFEGN